MKKLIMIACLLSASAFAANDGSLGSTSTGDIDIYLAKGNLVQISNLQDINFGANNSAPSELFIDFCVYSSTGSYTLTTSSDNPNNLTHRLANQGATEFIDYDVVINDSASGTLGDGEDLNHNSASTTQGNASATTTNCGGGNNARLFIDIDATSFGTATSDVYSDNLELLVSPI